MYEDFIHFRKQIFKIKSVVVESDGYSIKHAENIKQRNNLKSLIIIEKNKMDASRRGNGWIIFIRSACYYGYKVCTGSASQCGLRDHGRNHSLLFFPNASYNAKSENIAPCQQLIHFAGRDRSAESKWIKG
jgi:hypothetical protein